MKVEYFGYNIHVSQFQDEEDKYAAMIEDIPEEFLTMETEASMNTITRGGDMKGGVKTDTVQRDGVTKLATRGSSSSSALRTDLYQENMTDVKQTKNNSSSLKLQSNNSSRSKSTSSLSRKRESNYNKLTDSSSASTLKNDYGMSLSERLGQRPGVTEGQGSGVIRGDDDVLKPVSKRARLELETSVKPEVMTGPYTNLSFLKDFHPDSPTKVKVKVYIRTLTGKLEYKTGVWSVSARLNDGTASMDVDLGDEVYHCLFITDCMWSTRNTKEWFC